MTLPLHKHRHALERADVTGRPARARVAALIRRRTGGVVRARIERRTADRECVRLWYRRRCRRAEAGCRRRDLLGTISVEPGVKPTTPASPSCPNRLKSSASHGDAGGDADLASSYAGLLIPVAGHDRSAAASAFPLIIEHAPPPTLPAA